MEEIRPSFRDGVYVFSMSGDNFGRIIEYRSDRTVPEGAVNLFELLGIAREEEKFVRDRCSSAFASFPVLAVGNNGGMPISVLFVPNFAYACLAFELGLPAGEVCRLFADGSFGEALISPSATSLARSGSPSAPSEDGYSYVLQLMERLGMPATTRTRYAPVDHRTVSKIFAAAQDIAGVELTVRIAESEGAQNKLFDTALPESVFSQGYLMIAMLTLLMEARKYSKDNRAYALMRGGSDVSETEVTFRLRDETFNRYALNFLERVAEYNGMFCECKVTSGRVTACLRPFYADIGQTGVKNKIRLI